MLPCYLRFYFAQTPVVFDCLFQTPLSCAAGSVLVSLFDDASDFLRPEFLKCAPVQSPYVVDTADCEKVIVNDPVNEYVMAASELQGE